MANFLLKDQFEIKGFWGKFNVSWLRVPWLVFKTKEYSILVIDFWSSGWHSSDLGAHFQPIVFLFFRHLAVLNQGLRPKLYYPKPTDKPLFTNLVKQCQKMQIDFLTELPSAKDIGESNQVIVDALFGFSFKGEPRPYAAQILERITGLATNSFFCAFL